MNVKVLRDDIGKVVGQYAAAGDSITSQEARATVTAARGGQLMGVFDHGQVVGLIAVDPATGEVTETTSLPGVDITDPVDRVIDHYAGRGRQRPPMASGNDYRPPRQPANRRPHTQRPIGTSGLDTEDMSYEEYELLDYNENPRPNMDGNWNQETRENSDFINSWGADEATGVVDPGSSGQIKWPEQTHPGPEPIATMTTNNAVISHGAKGAKKKKPVVGIILGILFLGLIAGGVALYLTGKWEPIAKAIGIIKDEPEKNPEEEKSDDPIYVSIPDGYGSGQIGEILVDAGVIDSISDFHKEVVRQSAESSLKSGSYVFRQTMSMSEIVEILVSGPNDSSSRITVPEGLSVAKTAALVESNFGIPADEFKEQAKASNYVADYPFLDGVGDDSLEGFLFPKTYDFSGKTPDADMVIRKMLDQFQQEVDLDAVDACKDEINAKYNLSLSRYDIIKMASVIEREATNDDDRPHIASVFYNRLRDNMALQSDATIGYVLDHQVTADDLQNNDSPYNSYKNKGLPPTPLCSPSIESLEAAKHPSDTSDYYFFIVEEDGYSNHSFSQTYDQHQEVIANAKREMAEKGLSADSVIE